MPIKGYWLVPYHTYCQKMYGDITSEDLIAITETMREATMQGSAGWLMVCDTVEIDTFSIPSQDMIEFFKGHRPDPNNPPHEYIVILQNRAFRFLGDLLSNVLRERYVYLSTRYEAIDYLAEHAPDFIDNFTEQDFR